MNQLRAYNYLLLALGLALATFFVESLARGIIGSGLTICAAIGIAAIYTLSFAPNMPGRVILGISVAILLICGLQILTPVGLITLGAFLIWSVRSLTRHRSFAIAAVDGLITLGSLYFAAWSLNTSGSLALAVWSFFLAQSLTLMLPKSLTKQSENGYTRATSEDRSFETAHAEAQNALKVILRRSVA